MLVVHETSFLEQKVIQNRNKVAEDGNKKIPAVSLFCLLFFITTSF
jgi:hypothetical protein